MIKMLHSLSIYEGFKEDEEGKHCHQHLQHSGNVHIKKKGKGKVIPLQARCGPEGG